MHIKQSRIQYTIAVSITVFSCLPIVSAQNTTANDGNDGDQVQLEIMPKAELDVGEITSEVRSGSPSNAGLHVRDRYNKKLKDLAGADKVDEQIASGVVGRDTIMDYAILLLKFLSQAGLAIGGLMIIYAGYKYMMSALGAGSPDKNLIKNAIIGILVIIFSYAIMRALTRAFIT